MHRWNLTRGYEVAALGIDPGPEYFGRPRQYPTAKPKPQTEAQRQASEADALTFEEHLTRSWR